MEFDSFEGPEARTGVDERHLSYKWLRDEARHEPATLYYHHPRDQFVVFRKSDELTRIFIFEGVVPVITCLPCDYFTEESCRKRREITPDRK
jgi:hypothetical protein